jgi:hypothetical protein
MFAFDRETATLVAAVLCVAATIYIYNEFKKNRQDMEEFKNTVNEKQRPVIVERPSRIQLVKTPVEKPSLVGKEEPKKITVEESSE